MTSSPSNLGTIRRPKPRSAGLSCAALLCASLVVGALPAAGQLPELEPRFCATDDARVPVLLVGSFHMANPGLDQFNAEVGDMLSPERQTEIRRVVDALASFGPTVVAVESRSQEALDERWEAYASGAAELTANERQQLGFRLVEEAGLERPYAVDVGMALPDAKLGEAAASDPADAARLGGLQRFGQAAVATIEGWLRKGSVGETLYRMNTPRALAWAHRPYMEFVLPVGGGDDPAGAEYLSRWYERNIRIFARILEVAPTGDERVFVVYGQGHAKILQDMVADHPGMCVEDPLPYLERAR